MEQRLGNLGRARELFQSGVWAEPGAPTVTTVWQAWAVLEAHARNHDLARQMFKCAVKADPSSKPSWGVSLPPRAVPCRAGLAFALSGCTVPCIPQPSSIPSSSLGNPDGLRQSSSDPHDH